MTTRSRCALFGLLFAANAAASCGSKSDDGDAAGDAATGAPSRSSTSSTSDASAGTSGGHVGSASGATSDSGVDPDASSHGGVDGDVSDAGASTSAIPFSATGPWRAKLPADAPLAANSAALAAQIQSDITNNDGTWSINTDTFSAPYFVTPADTPLQTWTWSNCQKQTGAIYAPFAASLQNIPTLSTFLASKGSDSEIAIYSPSLDTYWDFWVASADAGQWSACFGGKIDHASTNPGIFSNGLGATAGGLPLGGWLLRIAELQAGLIEHALGFQVVHTQKTNFSWPANRTDGTTAGADYPMEGQRFRLDPTFDIGTLSNPAERTIARALQDYGMLLTDTSGAVILQAEDPRPYMADHGGVNPYTAIWSNLPVSSVLKDIPIAKLQALPQDYGKDFMN